MQDKSFHNNNKSEISSGFQEYINNFVKDATLAGNGFDTFSKYAKIYGENETLDIELLLKRITSLLDSIKANQSNMDDSIKHCIKRKAKMCFVSNDTINQIIEEITNQKKQDIPQKDTKKKKTNIKESPTATPEKQTIQKGRKTQVKDEDKSIKKKKIPKKQTHTSTIEVKEKTKTKEVLEEQVNEYPSILTFAIPSVIITMICAVTITEKPVLFWSLGLLGGAIIWYIIFVMKNK